jgi:regulator of protease activity HflC (stomatin/prohibitin superfamily)
VIHPNEALVMTLFGKYVGTLKGAGFYFVNPFMVAAPVPVGSVRDVATQDTEAAPLAGAKKNNVSLTKKRLSLKTMALSNDKQKVNDKLGNPIIISIVVIWHVRDTAKAMFDVDNFVDYLSIQSDSALRNIVRLYPYDSTDDEDANEKSLRGSSLEVSGKLAAEIQSKVDVAGIEIVEAKITHLAYAPEIAAAMLQRQQASAIVDARQLIVEGAVGMVEMAIEKLNENSVVELDEERKAAMVSNLMVVLCGNRDAQPVVNSGSLY